MATWTLRVGRQGSEVDSDGDLGVASSRNPFEKGGGRGDRTLKATLHGTLKEHMDPKPFSLNPKL